MNLESIPIVKFEIERMKSSIMSHLGAHGSEYGVALADAISKAVQSYDFEKQVKAIVHSALQEKINNYFVFGAGSQKIKQAVDDAFKKSLSGTELEHSNNEQK